MSVAFQPEDEELVVTGCAGTCERTTLALHPPIEPDGPVIEQPRSGPAPEPELDDDWNLSLPQVLGLLAFALGAEPLP